MCRPVLRFYGSPKMIIFHCIYRLQFYKKDFFSQKLQFFRMVKNFYIHCNLKFFIYTTWTNVCGYVTVTAPYHSLHSHRQTMSSWSSQCTQGDCDAGACLILLVPVKVIEMLQHIKTVWRCEGHVSVQRAIVCDYIKNWLR